MSMDDFVSQEDLAAGDDEWFAGIIEAIENGTTVWVKDYSEDPEYPDYPVEIADDMREIRDFCKRNMMVEMKAPAWAWDVIMETLAMDMESSMIEPRIREELSRAVDALVPYDS